MKHILDKTLEILASLILVTMILIVTWQVIARTILQQPNTMTEELVRFSLVWFAMLASAYVVGKKAHLAVTLLSDSLKGTHKKILEIVVQILFVLLAALIMVYGGFHAVTLTMGQLSPSLGIPMGYVYLSVPVSGVLIILYSCINVYDTLTGKSVIHDTIK